MNVCKPQIGMWGAVSLSRRGYRKLLGAILAGTLFCADIPTFSASGAEPGMSRLVVGDLSEDQLHLSLKLVAPPGVYVIQAATGFPFQWADETNVTIVGADQAELEVSTLERTPLFLRAMELEAIEEVRLQTATNGFAGMVTSEGADPPAIEWHWSDGTSSSDYPVAAITFPSAAARDQTLSVFPSTRLTKFNIGFDRADGGHLTPLEQHPSQNVTAVTFPRPLKDLQIFACSYNPITNTLDFRGFSSLEYVEAFQCRSLQQVVMTNLPALKRVCLEACDLRDLDLSGNPNLGDVRAAVNKFTNIVVGRGTGPRVWHWCVRDNPQMTQQFRNDLTNFYSLEEFWVWNAGQDGHLEFVSTNLTSVRAFRNRYTSSDVSGHTNMFEFRMFANQLTNVVMSGSAALKSVELQTNQLPAAVLDALLAEFDLACPNIESVNLSGNAEPPSPAGLIHYTNLINRGVSVWIDFAGPEVPTNPPPGTNAVRFVTTSQEPSLEIQTSSSPTMIIWHWGDGSTTTNETLVSHWFGEAATFTNYVEVIPPETVTYFGTPRSRPGQGIRGIYGLSKFSNLDFLYLFQENLVDLSIAGCANLRELHLADTDVSVEVCDQWFLDLDAAVTSSVTNAHFWYPAERRSEASDAAWGSLVSKGFEMHPY